MTRRIRWNDPDLVLTKEGDEECTSDCIELRDELQGLYFTSIILSRKDWEWIAEGILEYRDRRKAEAAKQPKRWLVDLRSQKATVQEDSSGGRKQTSLYFRENWDEAERLYVWAKDEKDAIQRAREANHSLGVWIREYLA